MRICKNCKKPIKKLFAEWINGAIVNVCSKKCLRKVK